MFGFKSQIQLLGINPFVFVPEPILKSIFHSAGKDKGPISIKGTINKMPYKQTLVKYSGHWRLYINTSMLKYSPKRIGEEIDITIDFDPDARNIEPIEEFVAALSSHRDAKTVYEQLPPSRRLEINRYLSRLKTPEARQKNVGRAIRFLLGKERFIGREKP